MDRWLHGANKSDLEDAQRGADHVYMNKAVRRVLLIVAGESSEILASFWFALNLPFLYYGNNRDNLYVVENLFDPESADEPDKIFYRTLYFSFLDFVAQAFTFFLVLVFLKVGGGLNAFSLGLSYIHHMDLFSAVLSASVLLNFASLGFFLKHAGCDTPELGWFHAHNVTTSCDGD